MASPKPRIIMHVDLDAFYASVETREIPSLKGQPVIVGFDPKEGKGRGVVVAASYESRKLGVHAGQPISRAYKLCPQATYLRPNFPLYGKTSASVMKLLRSFADKFEQVSIDEAFLDISDKTASYEEARIRAVKIKQELETQEQLTCSIGIAPNKSTAKIAADFSKPDGLTVVPPDQVKQFLAPLPVNAITGVGKKTEQLLKSLGVETIGQLQNIPGKDLVKYFGKGGVWLWGVAHGQEQIEVIEQKPVKSLAAEHTFEHDTEDKTMVLTKMQELADDLHRRLTSANLEFRTVGIKIRFKHFQTYTREHSLPSSTNSRDTILQVGKDLLREFEKEDRPIRLIGLHVSNLEASEPKGEGLEQWMNK